MRVRNLLKRVHKCACASPAHFLPNVELRYFLALFLVEVVFLSHVFNDIDAKFRTFFGFVGFPELVDCNVFFFVLASLLFGRSLLLGPHYLFTVIFLVMSKWKEGKTIDMI